MDLRTLILIAFTALWFGLSALVVLPVSAMPDHSAHSHHSDGDPTVPAVFPFDPEAESLFNKGLDRLYASDYAGAIAALSESLMIAPDYRVYLKRGEIYSQTEAWTQAITDYTHALNMGSIGGSYVHSLRGMAWEAIGDFESAIADYTETLRIYPEDGVGYTRRGAVYAKLGKILAASCDFADALRLNPSKAEAYLERGNFRLKLGNQTGAVTDYHTALKLFVEQGKTTDSQAVVRQLEKLAAQSSPRS